MTKLPFYIKILSVDVFKYQIIFTFYIPYHMNSNLVGFSTNKLDILMINNIYYIS